MLCDGDDAFTLDTRWTLTATGLLLHNSQPHDVADALHGLLVRPEARRLVAQGARRVVEWRFSLKRQLRQYEELLQEMLRAFNRHLLKRRTSSDGTNVNTSFDALVAVQSVCY